MIETYLQRHEQFLEHLLNDTYIPASQIRAAIHYALFPGGKRIRPVLVYLLGQLIKVDINVLDVIAAAIELTHCYSLVHDDLPAMDDDDLRRGKPSCHKAFGEATAILVGDGMQALAIELLLTRLPSYLSPSQVITVTQELVKSSGVSGMVSGQSLDLSELTKDSVSEQQLREIHHLKTGKLISACIEMILAAKNSLQGINKPALRAYAGHLGLVFQIQDDYLDCYAPTQLLGKSRSSDLANKKTTFATLYSKTELEEEINSHYQVALELLHQLDHQNSDLVELTKKLQQRSNIDLTQ